jgi:trk system potassium uptake protein TrkH
MVRYILGLLLFFEAGFMLIATGVAFVYGEYDFFPLLWSFMITMAVATSAYVACRHKKTPQVNKRKGYMIVTFVWVVFSFFGLLPFYISGAIPQFVDAFFETMSGFTTTGATVVDDVEALPHGLLLWRSLIQWMGGMGIIVLSLAVLPKLGIGAMRLFSAEAPGPIKDKFRPRIADTAKILWGIYLTLTLAEAVALGIAGMPAFDAVCHALTTVSTGGYSTRNDGIAAFQSPAIEYTVIPFMILAGVNYTVMYFMFARRFGKAFSDEEVRFYLSVGGVFTVIAVVTLLFTADMGAEATVRTALFQVISALSGTGFGTVNYMQWHPFLWTLLLLAMLVGGCAGSASGGLKSVRVLLLLKNSALEFKRLLHPMMVAPVKLNSRVVSERVVSNVLAFAVIYTLLVLFSMLVLSVMGIDFVEAVGATVISVSNVGTGFDVADSSGCYAHFPAAAKWYMSFLMLTGRLEIFTVLFYFMPEFWRE